MVLLVVIVAWGLGPVVVKLIDVTPMLGAALRFGVSIPLLAGLLIARGGRLTRPVFMKAVLPGASFGINLIFVFASLQEVTVAVLAVVIALHPALILMLSVPVFGERPSPRQLVWTVIGVLATVGVVLGAGGALRASSLGVLLCLVSLATFAIYFVLSRIARSTSDVDPVAWMTGINIWALAVCIIVTIAAGDLGNAAAKKYDCEVWLPSEGAYREVTSCSNYLDYSARRLDARVKGESGSQFAHTLNGTAIPVARMLVFLMEHYQQADGTFTVPEVLRPFCGLTTIAPPA